MPTYLEGMKSNDSSHNNQKSAMYNIPHFLSKIFFSDLDICQKLLVNFSDSWEHLKWEYLQKLIWVTDTYFSP